MMLLVHWWYSESEQIVCFKTGLNQNSIDASKTLNFMWNSWVSSTFVCSPHEARSAASVAVFLWKIRSSPVSLSLRTLKCKFILSQDLPNAMNAAEITDKLGLHSLRWARLVMNRWNAISQSVSHGVSILARATFTRSTFTKTTRHWWY